MGDNSLQQESSIQRWINEGIHGAKYYCMIQSILIRNKKMYDSQEHMDRLIAMVHREGNKCKILHKVSSNQGACTLLIANQTDQQIRKFIIALSDKSVGRSIDILWATGKNQVNQDELLFQYKITGRELKLSERLNISPLFYEDLDFYQILLSVDQTEVMRSYTAQVIEPVIAYDKRQHTDLYGFICAYIKYNGNQHALLMNLSIHKKMLNSRIKKIKEIADLDLTNLDDLLRINLCLHIKNLNIEETNY